jgi:hypothetical protein
MTPWRAALALVLLSLGTVAAAAPDRRIAITIDDLPWQSLPGQAPADLPARHARLMAQLRQTVSRGPNAWP